MTYVMKMQDRCQQATKNKSNCPSPRFLKWEGFADLLTSLLNLTNIFQLDERNQGNTRVVDGEPCTSNCGHNISTVLLDDLLEVIPFKTAIMKIDIQAHEHKAFAHAEKLLDSVSIPFIFMEFQEMKTLYISSNHISKDKIMIANMIAMLQRRGYKPRSGIRSSVLNTNTWQYWPNDMVWVRD